MSIFSIIKRGRKQAKDQKAKAAEKQQDETVKLPYRHVVTHAASDALATAPSSWKHDDRPRIMEQNRRRSAMVANGMSSQGLPRVGSNLSYVSHPSVYSSPIPPLPKNYSYSSIPSTWREKIASSPDSVEEPDYFRAHRGKGKEAVRFVTGSASPMISSGRNSALSNREMYLSTGEGAGSGSGSGYVSGSDDERVIEEGRWAKKDLKNTISPHTDPKPPFRNNVAPNKSESFHRLHPAQAHARRASEATGQSDRHYPPLSKSTYFAAPTPRPSSRQRVSADPSAPPVPALPGQYVIRFDSSSSTLSLGSVGMAMSTAPSSVISEPTNVERDRNPSPAFEPEPSISGRQSRRFSFSSSRRNSVETVVPASVDRPTLDQQTAISSSRGRRRLSKSKMNQSIEAERSPSVDNAPEQSSDIPFGKNKQELDRRPEREGRKARPNFLDWNSSSSAGQPSSRRRLSKGPPEPKTPKEPTPKSSRWSWSRRSSVTSLT